MRMGFKLSGLLVVSIMVGSLLLASCSATTSSPTAQDTKTPTKPQGSLVLATRALSSASLDPAEQGGAAVFRANGAAFLDSLVDLDDKGQITPGIAEKWELAPDGMSITFYVRKGVKFHDGSDLTGADVKFSLERIIAPTASHTDSAEWRSVVSSIELKDDYTVVIRLKQQQGELLKGMYELSGSSVVLPKKYIEEKGIDYWRKNPIGSGPWKVVKYESGARLELEANENYWNSSRVPRFKNITSLTINEEASKVAMLKTGELDIAPIEPDSVSGLKSAGLNIDSVSQGAQSFLFVWRDMNNPKQQAVGDVNVRKAMSLSINRKEMADQLYRGYAEPSYLWYLRPTAYFYDPNVLKPDPYDPEGAKKLLAEAGYANGFNTKIWDTGGTNSILLQAAAGYFRKVGITAELTPIDIGALTPMYRPAVKPEVYNSLWGIVGAAAGMQFEKIIQGYHSTKGAPGTTKNARLDELIGKVPLTVDPAEKKRFALEAVQLAHNEYGVIALLNHQTLYAHGAKVGSLPFVEGVPELALKFWSVTPAR